MNETRSFPTGKFVREDSQECPLVSLSNLGDLIGQC
jgi:hypothetical protein